MATIKLPNKLGYLLLGIWLIIMGINQAGWLALTIPGWLLGSFAIIAGIVIILDR